MSTLLLQDFSAASWRRLTNPYDLQAASFAAPTARLQKQRQHLSAHRALGIPLSKLAPVKAVPHISEEMILSGSAAISLALPALSSRLRGSKVETVSAKEAFTAMSDPGTRLVDIRTRSQIRRQGIPFDLSSSKTAIVHAPKMLVSHGKVTRNPNFEDEVLFARGVDADTAFIILDSHGDVGERAAQAIAKLGNQHDICVVRGGFKAWQEEGLPSSMLDPSLEKRYFCRSLAMVREGKEAVQSALVPPGEGGAATGALVLDSPAPPGVVIVSASSKKVPIFRPKMLDVLAQGYGLSELKQDVLSGMVIGVIALSLSMALGIASEATPAVGLYTAVVAGFIISALGGSKVVVGGPTAAFIPIVVGIAHEYGPENLVIVTAMGGLMLIAMGLTGLGSLVKFVPRPVVTGFTAGIATYIFSTQVKDFLGMGVPGGLPPDVSVPSEFIEKVLYLGSNLACVHGPSTALAVACLALMGFYPEPWRKFVPPQIAAVVAGTLGLLLLDGPLHAATGIETIGSHFGAQAIPSQFPVPKLPASFSPEVLPELIKPAATIALLASIESLLCARVADTMIGDRHNPNTELIAQGAANIASAAFGGLPATGALARTAANIRAGALSPVSGMVHALTVYAIIMVASPLAQYIPLPTLSAILVVVALNMGEWHNFKLLPGWPEKDAMLFLIAFTLTLLQDVSVAVEVGMVVALLLFVQDVTSSVHVRTVSPGQPLTGMPASVGARQLSSKTSASSAASRSDGMQGESPSSRSSSESDTHDLMNAGRVTVGMSSSLADLTDFGLSDMSTSRTYSSELSTWDVDTDVDSGAGDSIDMPRYAAYVEVTGPLLFGAGDMLEDALEEMNADEPVRVVLLNMSAVTVMDVSGLEVMEEQYSRLHRGGKYLVLCGLARQPLRMLSRAGFLDEVGRDNVCRSVEDAVHRAATLVEEIITACGSVHIEDPIPNGPQAALP